MGSAEYLGLRWLLELGIRDGGVAVFFALFGEAGVD